MNHPSNGRGQRVGYVRVSSLDQNTARQLDSQRIEESVSKACIPRDLGVSRETLYDALRSSSPS